MSSEIEIEGVVEVDAKTELRKFSPSDAAIARMAEQYMPLVIRDVSDAAGFKVVHEARMIVKSHRVEVEKTRKLLKADALEYGRKVDAEAKRLTGLLEPIESHLEAEEKRIQEEKDRIKNAVRLKAEAEARAKEEAESARLKAEQAAEAEHLRVEREKLDAERRAMEEQRRVIEVEQQRLAKIEADHQRVIELEKAKAEAAERAKRETEARLAREAEEAKAKAEAAEAAKRRAEELRPDREKLLAVAIQLRTMTIPRVSADANEAAEKISRVIRRAADAVEEIAGSVGVDGSSLF